MIETVCKLSVKSEKRRKHLRSIEKGYLEKEKEKEKGDCLFSRCTLGFLYVMKYTYVIVSLYY